MCPRQYPESTRPSKPIQDGYDMEACVAFHKRVTQTDVSTLAKGAYVPSASQGIRLRVLDIGRSRTVLVYAYCTADRNKKMPVWCLTVLVF